MDLDALKLAARFVLPPNSLGYCGKDTAPAKFIDCVINDKCEGVEEELGKFVVFTPYAKTLAEIFGKQMSDYRVIEAYWLGNDELKKTRPEHYKTLLRNFSKQGVPPWLVSELKQRTPKQFIPIHLFQVLHVGVGRASGSVPFNIETINNCMVRWGKVVRSGAGKLTINLNSLAEKNLKYKLAMKQGIFSYRSDFLPGLKSGDNVAVHWKQVVKVLTEAETANLSYWTKQVLATIN